ncbi:MAG: hypothetical protein LAO78_12230 [Acidobacteriia bacterium]|nr:hypothetical protein [Terriglobia bacterium]
MWLFLLLGGVLSCNAAESPTALQLETVPQSLELTSCEEGARLLAIVRNPSSTEIAADLELKTFADVPVKVAPEPAMAKTLKPGETISWEFNVTCTSGFSTGAMQVVLSNQLNHAGVLLSQIATKPVTLKLRDPQLFDNIAAIDVKSTLESLTSSDNGELNVAVTNKTVRPFKITIKPTGPTFIEFDPKEAQGKTIDPLRAETVRFIVKATDRVKPGKHLLIFNVQLETDRGKRDFLVTREVTVGVMGESEALKLLGAPSLLFLPGFLVVSSYLFFWRTKWLRHDPATTPPVEEKSSGFWLLSITLSMAISGLFWVNRRDFFSYYGLADLMMVWGISIGLGFGTYVIWHGYLNWREARKYPGEKDTAIKVLRKLKPITSDMAVPRIKFKKGKQPAFLLMENADGSAYVCPQMLLSWDTNADPILRDLVRAQLKAGGKLETVLQTVEEELKKRKQSQPSSVKDLIWDMSDPENNCAHKISKEELLERDAAEILVREAK